MYRNSNYLLQKEDEEGGEEQALPLPTEETTEEIMKPKEETYVLKCQICKVYFHLIFKYRF